MDFKTSLDLENLTPEVLALLEEQDQEIRELKSRSRMLEKRIIQMSCSSCGEPCSSHHYNEYGNRCESKCGQCPNRLCQNCQLADIEENSDRQWCIECGQINCPTCALNGNKCNNCGDFTCGLCASHVCDQNEYDPDNF